jgi:hypothetical protein
MKFVIMIINYVKLKINNLLIKILKEKERPPTIQRKRKRIQSFRWLNIEVKVFIFGKK